MYSLILYKCIQHNTKSKESQIFGPVRKGEDFRIQNVMLLSS